MDAGSSRLLPGLTEQAMDTQSVRCPYCGEWLEIFIDQSVRQQEYIEDCQVCCRPITLTVTPDAIDNRVTDVQARTEEAL